MLIRNRVIWVFLITHQVMCKGQNRSGLLQEVFSWDQIDYLIDGISYSRDANVQRKAGSILFEDEFEEQEKFFIQYNNVPIGFEVYKDKVFVTVPRRRFGIPSTLNYVSLSGRTPVLKPYPDAETKDLVYVYRPRVDACDRLWMVDTGLLEVPGARQQVQQPAILVYDLKTGTRILRYTLKDSDLVNERTSGGLTSITVDVTKNNCDDAYAYINDLATEGLVVFSLKERTSWRIQHSSFMHDEASLNFSVAGYTINWKDGLFSVALTEPDDQGKRKAYYHPLVSTEEYAVDTEVLKNFRKQPTFENTVIGNRGANTQSGSHGYHPATRTMFYANVAQDAILCWNIDTKMAPENVAIAAQDHQKLVYISDLKVIGDEVWVLVNQIPRFVFASLNPREANYYIHRAKVNDLIRGTVCNKGKAEN